MDDGKGQDTLRRPRVPGLGILSLLRGGELCVCDLVNALRVAQLKVSRHLAYLRKAGLVIARQEALWAHYELAPPKNEFHRKVLECLTCCFGQMPELGRDAERLCRGKCAAGAST